MGQAHVPTVAEDGKLRCLTASALRVRLSLHEHLAELEPMSPFARLALIERRRGAEDGLGYLAYALPEREAVWWGCMCVLHASQRQLPAAAQRAIEAAQAWVRRPSEAGRRDMLPLVREAGGSTPAAFVARAVFASRTGDPASLRAGFSVCRAVLEAAAAIGASARASELAGFRASALDIAAGGAGWIEAGKDPVTP